MQMNRVSVEQKIIKAAKRCGREKENKSQSQRAILLLIELIRAAAELDIYFVDIRCWPSEGVINHNTQSRHLTKVLNALIKQIYIDQNLTYQYGIELK